MAMPTARAFALTGRTCLRVSALCAAIAIAGCEEQTALQDTPTQATIEGNAIHHAEIRHYTDEDTGCVYLILSGYRKGGITPRLRSDGKPDCPTTPENN